MKTKKNDQKMSAALISIVKALDAMPNPNVNLPVGATWPAGLKEELLQYYGESAMDHGNRIEINLGFFRTVQKLKNGQYRGMALIAEPMNVVIKDSESIQ